MLQPVTVSTVNTSNVIFPNSRAPTIVHVTTVQAGSFVVVSVSSGRGLAGHAIFNGADAWHALRAHSLVTNARSGEPGASDACAGGQHLRIVNTCKWLAVFVFVLYSVCSACQVMRIWGLPCVHVLASYRAVRSELPQGLLVHPSLHAGRLAAGVASAVSVNPAAIDPSSLAPDNIMAPFSLLTCRNKKCRQ